MRNTLILNTINKLLKIKAAVSISDIADMTGKKKSDILNVLTNETNYKYIKFDTRGRVTNILHSLYVNDAKEEKYRSGLCFKTQLINYGVVKIINFHDSIKTYDNLKEYYICGGLGDSYSVNVIMYNEENLKKIDVPEICNVFIPKFESIWKE